MNECNIYSVCAVCEIVNEFGCGSASKQLILCIQGLYANACESMCTYICKCVKCGVCVYVID